MYQVLSIAHSVIPCVGSRSLFCTFDFSLLIVARDSPLEATREGSTHGQQETYIVHNPCFQQYEQQSVMQKLTKQCTAVRCLI